MQLLPNLTRRMSLVERERYIKPILFGSMSGLSLEE